MARMALCSRCRAWGALVAFAALALLSGCVADGFGLDADVRSFESAAVEPVPNLRTFRTGGGAPKPSPITTTGRTEATPCGCLPPTARRVS